MIVVVSLVVACAVWVSVALVVRVRAVVVSVPVDKVVDVTGTVVVPLVFVTEATVTVAPVLVVVAVVVAFSVVTYLVDVAFAVAIVVETVAPSILIGLPHKALMRRGGSVSSCKDRAVTFSVKVSVFRLSCPRS